MAEVRESFDSPERWEAWQKAFGPFAPLRKTILGHVRQLGFVEPFTGLRRRPHEILIRDDNLHESLSFSGLNSRMRALLVQLQIELRARRLHDNRRLRILGAEALSRIALTLRGQFPYYLGTEYLPSPEDRDRCFPVPHMDVQDIGHADESFDVFVSADVFEHVPGLDRALREIHRVLRPGGLVVSSFPFAPTRIATEVRASAGDGGEVVHQAPPEYHGNPVDPAGGSLVFQNPGWDLLPKLREMGFADAYYSTIASSHYGIASEGKPGPFILTAVKAGGSPRGSRRPDPVAARGGLPERLCAVAALPRSGTTLLTSMLAVHSEVTAVYEPWNAKVLDRDTDATLMRLAEREALGDLTGRLLVVKETAADDRYIELLGRLVESAPFPVETHFILLLRDPGQTLLSEVKRRNEWWGDHVEPDAGFLAGWCRNRGRSLWNMLKAARGANGMVVALEELAAHPERVMRELMARLGLELEGAQLEYEKHMDGQRPRGDLNVSRKPEPVSPALAQGQAAKAEALRENIAAGPDGPWFAAFAALHADVCAKGGITACSEIPAQLVEALDPDRGGGP